MKVLTGIILLALLSVIGTQLYRLNAQRVSLDKKLEKLEEEAAMLQGENEEVQSDIAYFSDPKNLAKEVRGIFNSRKPDEELFIIVPKRPE